MDVKIIQMNNQDDKEIQNRNEKHWRENIQKNIKHLVSKKRTQQRKYGRQV